MNYQKLAVIGCGNVGSTIAYTAMCSQLFSDMLLIDKNTDKAHGEAMDLNHCLPFLSPMSIADGDYSSLGDAGIIVIAAGANQQPGETRFDCMYKNIEILYEIIGNIRMYCSDAILLVVTNPVDVLTYEAIRLSGYPDAHVIGSGTVLDTARLKFLMGEKLKVDSRNVHSFIIGEHGDSEVAVWSSANISGIDLIDYFPICDDCGTFGELYDIYHFVKNSAYEIIRCKGATYYGIAQSAMRIIRSIVRDEKSILPVSTLARGHYGLSELCLGLPSVIGRGGVEHVLEIPLSDEEKRSLHISASALRDVIKSAEDMYGYSFAL